MHKNKLTRVGGGGGLTRLDTLDYRVAHESLIIQTKPIKIKEPSKNSRGEVLPYSMGGGVPLGSRKSYPFKLE